MAAEYQLYIKNEMEEVQVKDIFFQLNWEYKEGKIEDRGFLFTFISIVGFLLYKINKAFTVEMGTQKLTFKSVLTFRFINNVHFLISKKNMLRFILVFVKKYDEDFMLLFNGEIVIMMRNQEDGLVLGNTDFWAEELLFELNNLTYCRKNFEVL